MSEEVAMMQPVPEIAVNMPAEAKPPMEGFSGEWKDFAKDMAAIEKEQAVNTQPAPVIVEPQAAPTPEPVQPQAAPQAAEPPKATATPTPQAPQKFIAPDGTLDKDKLLKSYLEMEPQFKKMQNELKRPPVQPQAQPQATPQPPAAHYTPFATQLENEAKQIGLGPTLEKLAYALEESAYQRALGDVHNLKAESEKRTRQEELKAIADRDPWILTEEGFNTLKSIRETYPHINMAPEPWKEAYVKHLGLAAMNGKSVQPQVTPTPKAVAAPIAPAAAAVVRTEAPVKLDTRDDINAYVSKLNPEQEAEFWKRAGLRWR